MNNMQKSFKKKGACGLADGGRPNPHMLGSGMAASAGLALGGRGRQIEGAIEAATGAAPAPLVAPAGAGGMSNIRDGAMPPAYMLAAQRRGMADGGGLKRKPHGGEVEGPGGPTDDEAGVFALSNDEYVLPADTVEAMGGAEALDQIRDATHEFVDEKNRPDGLRGLANGSYPKVKPGAYTVTELPWERAPVAERVDVRAPRHTARAVEFQTPQRGAGAPISNRSGPGRPSAEVLRSAAPSAAPSAAQPVGGVQPRAQYAGGSTFKPGTGPDGAASKFNAGKAVKGLGALGFGVSAYDAATNGVDATNAAGMVAGASVLPGAQRLPGMRAARALTANPLALGAMAATYSGEAGAGSDVIPGAPKSPSRPLTPEQADQLRKNPQLTYEQLTGSDPGVPATGAARDQRDDYVPGAGLPSADQVATDQERARVAGELRQRGIGAAAQTQDAVGYQRAQGLSRRAPGETYKLGGEDRPGYIGNTQYSDSNADIFATSTRPDGKLNSFTGVGDGNRPNWEQRNPDMHREALARAAADKASVVSIATNYASQGDREGAYRMAAGDPAATAAVEQAFEQRGLRQAVAQGGKKGAAAASILAQQGKDATDVQVANIAAGGGLRVAQAKAQADMLKAQQDQRNADRTFGLSERTADREDGKYQQDKNTSVIESQLGKQFDKDGNLSPAWEDFQSKIIATAHSEGKSIDQLDEPTLRRYAVLAGLDAKTQPGALRSMINWAFGNRMPETDDLTLLQPDLGAGPGKDWLGNPTYKAVGGQRRYSTGEDLTREELEAVGLIKGRN